MKKRVFSVLLLLVIMVSSILPNQVYAASKLKLSKAKATMEVDSKLTLKLGDVKAADIKWTSSDKKIATVSKAVITAKSEGTATITATYEKKKYTCKVTVVDSNKKEKATPTPKPTETPKFSAKEAVKNISYTLQDTGEGVVAILENKNKVDVTVNATLAYYKNGKMIGTQSDSIHAFEAGKKCALFFRAPYDSDYRNIEYDDYKITMTVEQATYLITSASKIKVSSDFGVDNVTAEVTNNSDKDISYITLACVFYDDSGNPIGYEKEYAKCKTSGSVDYVSFRFPYDENYDTIQPSSYKIYVNSAYKYTWED